MQLSPLYKTWILSKYCEKKLSPFGGCYIDVAAHKNKGRIFSHLPLVLQHLFALELSSEHPSSASSTACSGCSESVLSDLPAYELCSLLSTSVICNFIQRSIQRKTISLSCSGQIIESNVKQQQLSFLPEACIGHLVLLSCRSCSRNKYSTGRGGADSTGHIFILQLPYMLK